MPLFINTNISSMYAQFAAQRASEALDVSYQRLSSGLRINSAKDDAAGIQVSNSLTHQLNGLTQGNRNAQDGIAFAQTAEGALDEITNMLQRIRVLSIQAATGTYSDSDREALQQEVDAMTEEICRVSNETTFAGSDILNGNASLVRFQVGPDTSSIITIDLRRPFDVAGLAAMADDYDTNGFVFEGASSVLSTGEEVNYAVYNYADFFKNNSAESGIDISTQSAAEITLAGIDGLINALDRRRADLGAMQNRLEATIRNQDNVAENVQSARANIRDTDFAAETAELTSKNIIQQATATILTQANQRPQVALSLLQQ